MDRELIKQLADVSECYEDICVEKLNIPMLLIGGNGIYIILEDKPKSIKEIFQTITCYLNLNPQQLMMFVANDDETGFFYDYTETEPVVFDDIYDAFEMNYINHLLPQVYKLQLNFETPADYCNEVDFEIDEETFSSLYVEPVVPSQHLERIFKKLEMQKETPEINSRYITYPDGRMETRREVAASLFNINEYGLMKNFPCMDCDGDEFFYTTLAGGWFGLHKFKSGNILHGLFYLVTLGCFGIFYLLDLLAIITGSYHYSYNDRGETSEGKRIYFKQHVYNRPVTKKVMKTILSLIASVMVILAVRFVYIPVTTYVSGNINQTITSSEFVTDSVEQIIQNMENIPVSEIDNEN